ncbi:MAG: pitrilysin family protein, partial [Gemmatimonadales bacterium]
LTLLVQPDHSASVVAVVTHVKAGYFDEPDEWVGISHVLEHMFFKGTERRGPGEIARDTQLLGGYLNAATSYDKTVYYTVLPAADGALERALDVQADALMHTALDSDEVNRELEVIIQEAKRKLDTPAAVTRETLYESLFTTHRMRRWRIGKEQGLRSLTERDLREYYASRYTPDRVIVGIAGDLDVDRAIGAAEEIYGRWELPAAQFDGSPAEPDSIVTSIRLLHGDVTRPLAIVGWRTVGTLDDDAPALDLVASLLGSGRGSLLYRALRAPGHASSASAMHYTPTEVGVFDIALETEPEKVDVAVKRAIGIVAEVIERGPELQNVERARAMMTARWSRQFESMDGRAGALCQAEALGGYELVDELHDRLLTVSADEAKAVAERHLDPERPCAVLYLPDGVRTGLSRAWPGAVERGVAPVAPIAVVSSQLPATSPVAADSTAGLAGGITHLALPGADLLVREKQGAGLVSVGVHVPGVTDQETEDVAGISRLLVRSALRGAGGMTGEGLAQASEVLGGGITPNSSADGLGWAMTVRSDSLRNAAELLRLVALEPMLRQHDVGVEAALQASDATRVRDDMYGYPLQRVLREAYAGDPYGLPSLGDPETVRAITHTQVQDWSARLPDQHVVVVAVGDLDTEALIEGLQPLANWPASPRSPASVPDPPVFHPAFDAEQRDKAQTALAMAFRATPYASTDRYALIVAGALLSGLAGRLFRELRDKQSLAYAVAALPWLRGRAGAVLTYIATSPESEAEARDAMLRELERLVAEDVPEDELTRARNYAAGLVEMRQQSGAAVAGEIMTAWVYGVLEELATTADRIRSVTAEDVASVVGNVFVADRAEFVVRGTGKSR